MVVGAAPAVHRLGVEQGADLAHRIGQAAVPSAIHADRAGVRVVKAEDQSHRGGLTSAVRAEEAGHLARPDAERQVVDGHFLAVSFREPPYLDHGIYPLFVKDVPQCAHALPSAASAAVMIPACYRGWIAGKEAQRPVRIGEELPPNGRACLSRASHQRCGPAASRIARPRCVRGSSRRKPAGRYPEVLPRMGLPAPSPGGGGRAHPCTPQFVPSRIGHAPSAELRSAAILDREPDTRPRVRSVSVLSGLHVGGEGGPQTSVAGESCRRPIRPAHLLTAEPPYQHGCPAGMRPGICPLITSRRAGAQACAVTRRSPGASPDPAATAEASSLEEWLASSRLDVPVG